VASLGMIKTMAGYSSTPLWKKLGYKTGMEAAIDGAPPRYVPTFQLPSEIQIHWVTDPKKGVAFVHVFCQETQVLKKKLAHLRKLLAPDGVIWISWPKKASGLHTDITEDVIRSCALPLGLVDIKVCAVDEVWSGLKLPPRSCHATVCLFAFTALLSSEGLRVAAPCSFEDTEPLYSSPVVRCSVLSTQLKI
jgi:hypothetical protein